MRLSVACPSLLLLLSRASEAAAVCNPKEFDYVIVGGGPAGLTLANRLSANPSISVAVIEAGGSVLDNPNVQNVSAYGLSLGTQIDWQYQSAPQIYSLNETKLYSAGKALGGTTAINGMTYLRAEDAQIDAWETLGNTGWNWAALFPFFKKPELFQPPTEDQLAGGATYDPDAHGFDGPVTVGWSSYFMKDNVSTILRATFEALGSPYNADANDGTMRGFTVWPFTLDASKDIRQDAARAYYWPIAESRKNLVVYLNSTATRITWEEDASPDTDIVATGVEFVSANNETIVVAAKKEVILSAGSIRSPALLELSGVGNPVILQDLGIDVVLALPTVGENLQDQPNIPILYTATQNFTGYPSFVTYSSSDDLFPANLTSVAEEVRSKIPALASLIAANSYNSTTVEIQQKLLQVQTDLAFGHNNSGSPVPTAELLWAPSSGAIIAPFWITLPYSRGSVHINTSDPLAYPVINPNFWQSDIDITFQAAAARVLRKAFATPPLSDYVLAEATPGFETVPEDASDELWGDWFKSAYGSNSHPIGTCSMMARELGGVVDPELRVYGTKNVRVVDGSVIPMEASGHPSSLIYALAERASVLILKDY